MLINLTNHPSALWDKAQQQAAAQYGECVDLPFPQVDPQGDEKYIDMLADSYLQKIKDISSGNFPNVTVHLMGEMTFVYALLEKLRTEGRRCIASTSERKTVDLGNGQKESTFVFLRFRDYFIR